MLYAEVKKMGGINHKPTDQIKLVGSAARVSRVVGLALETLISANTAYEEAIIAAANGSVEMAITHHQQSIDLAEMARNRLDDVNSAYAMMLEDIEIHAYPGNPLAPKINPIELAGELKDKILRQMNENAFIEVATHVRDNNLIDTFKLERIKFVKIRPLFEPYLGALKESFEFLRANTSAPREWIRAIDNGEIPIRSTFMPLLTELLGTFQWFVYSTAISTDLYYKTEGHGTFANEGGKVRSRS